MTDGRGGRSDQATLPPELAAQEAEIERLTADNNRLHSINVALGHNLVAPQQDNQRRRAHITGYRTEADNQIRVLMENIAKMEAERSAGGSIKEDLQQASMEAQGLLKTNLELGAKIQQARQELEKAQADIKRLPKMQSELESLKKEYMTLRTTFEYEKVRNTEKREELEVMERNFVQISRDWDNMCAYVANAERRARVRNPYGAPSNQDPATPRLQ